MRPVKAGTAALSMEGALAPCMQMVAAGESSSSGAVPIKLVQALISQLSFAGFLLLRLLVDRIQQRLQVSLIEDLVDDLRT